MTPDPFTAVDAMIESLRKAAAEEFERETDRIDGIPHVVRLVAKDGSSGSREQLAGEMFLNWLATKDDYALLRKAADEAMDRYLKGDLP